MTERREHFRRRTLLDGRLEIAKLNGWSLDCTVRNLSEAGARLAVPADVVVPRNVSLAVSNGTRRPAQLVWYHEGQAGFALGERRVEPRPVAANDSAIHEPVAKNAADESRAAPEREAATLAARIAAIATKSPVGKSPAEPRFTRS